MKENTHTEINTHVIGLFIFILIICGNYIGNLFPCRIQYLMNHSLVLRHILGYLTLVFFSILTLEFSFLKEKTSLLFLYSLLLYLFFLIFNKTPYYIWLTVFSFMTIMYLLFIYQKLQKKNMLTEVEENKKDLIEKDYLVSDKTVRVVNLIFMILIILLTISGFLIYLGEKKYEYKKDFSYLTFLFGKSDCLHYTKDKNVFNSIKHILD